jgi:hypothetical protein
MTKSGRGYSACHGRPRSFQQTACGVEQLRQDDLGRRGRDCPSATRRGAASADGPESAEDSQKHYRVGLFAETATQACLHHHQKIRIPLEAEITAKESISTCEVHRQLANIHNKAKRYSHVNKKPSNNTASSVPSKFG